MTAIAPYRDTTQVVEFLQKDPIRYRHLISDITAAFPEHAKAFCDYYGYPEQTSFFYSDTHDALNVLAIYRQNRLRVEGDEQRLSMDLLRRWVHEFKPSGLATTSEAMMHMLHEIVGAGSWSVDAHYALTTDACVTTADGKVSLLGARDGHAFQAFLQRPTEIPFLNVGRANAKLVRDFELMCRGLPTYCYAVRDKNDIVGVATVQPITTACEDITQVFVLREYRGRGMARSLISAATRDILTRGRQPVCAVGAGGILTGTALAHLGYQIKCCFHHRRYWSDVPQSGTKPVSCPQEQHPSSGLG